MLNRITNGNFAKPMLSAVHSEQREIDVQKLCEAVLDTSPNCWDNPNGAYESTCPFCYAEEQFSTKRLFCQTLVI